MPHTNVKSEWVDGNLVFYDKAGDEILTINGHSRALTLPAGSTLTNSGTSYVVTLPDDTTLEVSSELLQVKAAGIDETHIAASALDTDYLDGGSGDPLTLSAAAQAAVDLVAAIPQTNQASPAIWNDGGVLKVGTA